MENLWLKIIWFFMFFLFIFLSRYKIILDPILEFYQIMCFSYLLAILIILGFYHPLKNKIIFLYSHPFKPKFFRAVHYGYVKKIQKTAPIHKLYFTDIAIFNIVSLCFILFFSVLYQNFLAFETERIINFYFITLLFLAYYTSHIYFFIMLIGEIMVTYFLKDNAILLTILYISSSLFYTFFYQNLSLYDDARKEYEFSTGKTIDNENISGWKLIVKKVWEIISKIISMTIFLSLINDISALLDIGFKISLSSYIYIPQAILLQLIFAINKSILVISPMVTTLQIGSITSIYAKDKKVKKYEMYKLFDSITIYAFTFIAIYILLNFLLSFSAEYNIYLYKPSSTKYDELYRYTELGNIAIDLAIVQYMISNIFHKKELEKRELIDIFSKINLSFKTNNWVKIG